MHPSTEAILELFEYEHLPERMQTVARDFRDMAHSIALTETDRGAEQTTCLRKLLEAKDCAVRMQIPRKADVLAKP